MEKGRGCRSTNVFFLQRESPGKNVETMLDLGRDNKGPLA